MAWRRHGRVAAPGSRPPAPGFRLASPGPAWLGVTRARPKAESRELNPSAYPPTLVLPNLEGCRVVQDRLVGAERLLGQVVAVVRERARAASAADPFVLADPALPGERGRVAQLLEHRGLRPDVGEALLADVAGAHREVPARVDVSGVGHEADGRARQAAARHRGERAAAGGIGGRVQPRAVRDERRAAVALLALLHDALRAHPEVVRRAGRLQVDRDVLGSVVEPVQHPLVLVRRQHLAVGDAHPATDRHQHEDVQRVRAERQREVEQRREFRHVVPGDGRVDLDRHARVAQEPQAVHRLRVRSRNAAERVVGRRHRTVQADRHAGEPGVRGSVAANARSTIVPLVASAIRKPLLNP